MLLELRQQSGRVLLLLALFLSFFGSFLSISWGLWFLWWLWSDEEHISSCLVALRIAVKDITSILTVVLAHSPSESTRQQLRGDFLFGRIFLLKLVDLKL